jgi:hypothetical protein
VGIQRSPHLHDGLTITVHSEKTKAIMTFFDIRAKLIARWWLILAFVIGFTLAFYPWSAQRSHVASIGLGISLNSPEYAEVVQNNASSYAESLTEFTLYISARFESIEVQSKIAEEAGIGVADFNALNPFYTVVEQGGGYVSISYISNSRQQAENFLRASKLIYQEIIQVERNSRELAIFKVDPKTEFIENVAEVSRSPQYQALPSLAGLLLGVTVALIIPYKGAEEAK